MIQRAQRQQMNIPLPSSMRKVVRAPRYREEELSILNNERCVQISLPEKFEPLFQDYRYKSFYGGRGAAKSWAFADATLAMGMQEEHRILCTREYQSTIADSVYKLLCDRIHTLKLDNDYEILKNSISNPNTHTEYLFKGLKRNIDEIKSTEGITICWVEEAQNTSEHSWEVLIPTIFRRPNSQIWLSWNVGEIKDPTYIRFINNNPPGCISTKVNWRDNPFFPPNLKQEMDYLKKVDYESYLHIWEGEPLQISNANVFKNKWSVDDFDMPSSNEEVRIFQGADWGFSNDPAVLISFFIRDNNLYIAYEAYGVGVELDELFTHFTATVPTASKWKISADCSRPETISYLNKNYELTVEGAKKWSGSVEDGISFMKKFGKIIIHPRCIHTIEEFKKYSYKVDSKTGEVLPILVDKDNHCIDSIRYGLDDYIRGDVSFADFVGD